MKKITILALHLNYGGIEMYISSLCKMLQNDYDIEIICTYKKDEPAFSFDKKIKITYLIDGYPNKDKIKSSIKNKKFFSFIKESLYAGKLLFLKKARNIRSIKNLKSDYIITTRYYHNILVKLYAPKNIIKIATEHNYHNNNKVYVNKLINSISNFDYFILVSQNLYDYYSSKVNHAKCKYISNVIEDKPKSLSKVKNNNLICVGRLSKEKGQIDLIDVISEVKKKIDDVHLYLVGDGLEKESISKLIDDKKLNDSITLTGFLSKKELSKYYLNSSLFVLPSYTESFGLVLVEAMSYGLCPVAFDSSDGAKTLLKDNGILIKNRDKKEMSNVIVNLLNNKKELIFMQNSFSKYSSKFYIDNVKKEWLNLLER